MELIEGGVWPVRQFAALPNTAAALGGHEERYLDHLFGGLEGYVGLFSGERPEADVAGVVNKGRLRKVDSSYFRYPEGKGDILRYASEASGAGRNVYVCAHLLTERRRRKEYAGPVVCLWADADGGMPGAEAPHPTLVVESSPGKCHCYWRLLRPVFPHEAEALNRRLSRAVGADESGWDLTQLLRFPGSKNYDYAGVYSDVPTVRVVEKDGGGYAPGRLDALLPALPDDNRSGRAAAGAFSPPKAAEASLAPPEGVDVRRYLGRRGRLAFEGKDPVLNADGEVDRSASLYRIARELCEALWPHFREEEVLAIVSDALEERDESLGWDKFSSRPSRYRKVAEEALLRGGGR